jgi:hypothetical protein
MTKFEIGNEAMTCQTPELVRLFYRLTDRDDRDELLDLARELVAISEAKDCAA